MLKHEGRVSRAFHHHLEDTEGHTLNFSLSEDWQFLSLTYYVRRKNKTNIGDRMLKNDGGAQGKVVDRNRILKWHRSSAVNAPS